MEQKNKALGRGLEELFSSEMLNFDSFESQVIDSSTDNDIVEIKLSDIRSNPYQPRKRFDEVALRELSESIKNYGVFQPIIVKKSIKGYDLIAGERRVKASLLAGLETIPAIIKDLSDNMMREIALLENLQRENLNAIELALAYKGIIDNLHITQDDLAVKLGKSRSSITNMLGLLRLPQSVQDLVLDGKISMGHARELSKLDDESKIISIANMIIDKDLSVRDVERLSADIKPKNKKNKDEVTNKYNYIEREIEEFLGTKVKVQKNKIIISFENSNDLNRILDEMNIKID